MTFKNYKWGNNDHLLAVFSHNLLVWLKEIKNWMAKVLKFWGAEVHLTNVCIWTENRTTQSHCAIHIFAEPALFLPFLLFLLWNEWPPSEGCIARPRVTEQRWISVPCHFGTSPMWQNRWFHGQPKGYLDLYFHTNYVHIYEHLLLAIFLHSQFSMELFAPRIMVPN